MKSFTPNDIGKSKSAESKGRKGLSPVIEAPISHNQLSPTQGIKYRLIHAPLWNSQESKYQYSKLFLLISYKLLSLPLAKQWINDKKELQGQVGL